VTESTSEDEEMSSYSLGASRSVSLDLKKDNQGQGRLAGGVVNVGNLPLTPDRRLNSVENFLTPLSEPEMSPLQR
jgi:hypothetical protein